MNTSTKHLFLIFIASLVIHFFVLQLLFDRTHTWQPSNTKYELIHTHLLLTQDKTTEPPPKSTVVERLHLSQEAPVADVPPQETDAAAKALSSSTENGVHPSAEGGVFSRRLRRAEESGDARLRHLSASERQDLKQAQSFLLQLRHPNPDTNNEVLCQLQPTGATCTNSMTLPATLAREWFSWLQKGLAPQQMLINKSLLEEPSQIRREQAL